MGQINQKLLTKPKVGAYYREKSPENQYCLQASQNVLVVLLAIGHWCLRLQAQTSRNNTINKLTCASMLTATMETVLASIPWCLKIVEFHF